MQRAALLPSFLWVTVEGLVGMYQLWDDVVAPVIDAVGARRVIEIGALRGETTDADARAPRARAASCTSSTPSRSSTRPSTSGRSPAATTSTGGSSHDVLPGLPPADVVLIDGDHNWYTVYHELRMLADTARRAGAPLPVLVLHDVGWPYGRRDLYYEPDRIPEEFRQPYARAGMRPGQSHAGVAAASTGTWPTPGRGRAPQRRHDGARRLRRRAPPAAPGGRPADLLRAGHRGRGPACSTRTRSWRRSSTTWRAPRATGPARARRAHPHRRGDPHADLAPQPRGAGAAARDRYLDLVKALLLDERNLQHELRVSYLLGLRGAPPDAAVLRDPVRALPHRYTQLVQARQAGRPAADGLARPGAHDHGPGRSSNGWRTQRAGVLATGVPGDFVEVGVGGGGGAILLRAMLDAHEVPDRLVWLADPFSATRARRRSPATTPRSADLPPAVRRLASDLNAVRDNLAQFGLLDDRVRFLQGRPADTLADAPIDAAGAAAHRGGIGRSTPGSVLEILHPRLSPGAEVIVSGIADPEVEAAVGRARERLGITAPIERVDWNAIAWTHEVRPRRPRRRAGACMSTSWRAARSGRGRAIPAGAPGAAAERGAVGRRRLLQHAARGRPHAPLAVPLVPARHPGPRLRGPGGRQRLRPRPAPQRRLRGVVRARVPPARAGRRRPAVADRRRSTPASPPPGARRWR